MTPVIVLLFPCHRIFGPLILVPRHIRSFKRHQKTYHEDENVLWRFQTEDDKKKLEEIQAEELENEEEQFYEYDYEDIDEDVFEALKQKEIGIMRKYSQSIIKKSQKIGKEFS